MIELEDPVCNIGEEVTVVRHDNKRPLELLEIRLQAKSRLGIEMIRRLVEQHHVGIGKDKSCDRYAATFAAREYCDLL